MLRHVARVFTGTSVHLCARSSSLTFLSR
jgi:hypothetical protein